MVIQLMGPQMRIKKLALAIESHLQSKKWLTPDAAMVRSSYSPFADPFIVARKREVIDTFIEGIHICRRVVELPKSIKLSNGKTIQYIEDGDYRHELELEVDSVLGTFHSTVRSFEYSTHEYVYFDVELLAVRRITHLTKSFAPVIGYLNDQQ